MLQSGMLAGNVTMQQRSVPFSYVISCGNQAMLGAEDFIDVLVDDPAVTAIGLYIERLARPRPVRECGDARAGGGHPHRCSQERALGDRQPSHGHAHRVLVGDRPALSSVVRPPGCGPGRFSRDAAGDAQDVDGRRRADGPTLCGVYLLGWRCGAARRPWRAIGVSFPQPSASTAEALGKPAPRDRDGLQPARLHHASVG